MTMTTAMLTEGGLYRLLAWLSPSFPVGAFSYSHGIEAAVEAGRVADRASLEAWVGAILRHGTGRIDADLFRDAWRAVAAREDCIADRASFETPAMPAPQDEEIFDGIPDVPHPEERPKAASRRTVAALVLRDTRKSGLLRMRSELTMRPLTALTAFLHAVAANLVSAGLRLVPLGQTDGQRVLRALEPVVADCVAAALDQPARAFGGCALAAELASIDHESQYSRLFRS